MFFRASKRCPCGYLSDILGRCACRGSIEERHQARPYTTEVWIGVLFIRDEVSFSPSTKPGEVQGVSWENGDMVLETKMGTKAG